MTYTYRTRIEKKFGAEQRRRRRSSSLMDPSSISISKSMGKTNNNNDKNNSNIPVAAAAPAAVFQCPRCESTNTKFCYYNNYTLAQPRHFCKACKRYWTRGDTLRNVPVGGGCRKHKKRPINSYLGESSTSSGPEVSDAVPYFNRTKEFFSNATHEVSDTDEVMNISPELEKLLGIHTTQFIEKFQAELTGFRYDDGSFNRFNLENLIIKQFFKTAQVVDGIKSYDGVTEEEFSKLFSRYEASLLKDCISRSQMLQDASSPMSQKRAGSTGYRSIQSFVDRFIEKNGNTIGDDQVKLDQYGMPCLRAYITLKFFQMVEESGLMLVMDDNTISISNMLHKFEEDLLRDCIQEIQKGPIQKELIKTFAQPESHEEEKLDQRIRKINFLQDINLDSAIQGAAVVVGHVFSSSKSPVVLIGMMSALLIGISCSSLAHLLRNKHESVSKVLTKVGLMGTASTVIIAIAALFPQVIMSCIFGTIAILLLAFTVILN